MTIIFPCSCGKCSDCYLGDYKFQWGNPKPAVIVSRKVYEYINRADSGIKVRGYNQEYPTTATEAVITNESHDQKKSRLKREHLEGMHKALHKGVSSGNRIR